MRGRAMAVYTELTLESARQITRAYGVSPTGLQPLAGGQANSNYRLVVPTGDLVLTLFEVKEAAEVQALALLVDHLHRAGIPTPRVLSTLGGDRTTTYGGRPVILKFYVQGEIACGASSSIHHQLGAIMARLHAVPPPPTLRCHHDYGVDAFAEVTALDIDHPFLPWLHQQEEAIRRLPGPALPRGLIHGDLFCDNVIARHGELVAVLDFEVACHQPLVFDLGMAFVGMCGRDEGPGLDLQQAAQIVAGYETERLLAAEEWEVLAGYTVYAAVATAFWRFRQFNLRHPGHVKRERYREMWEVAEWVRSLGPATFAGLLRP